MSEHEILETRMIDISDKAITQRLARAYGRIQMQANTLDLICQRAIAKGDVLTIAQMAGIQGAKKCADLIPLCHPLLLTSVKVELEPDPSSACIHITATVKVTGQTGVEMEALSAVSAAALTIYDMCKGVDAEMVIEKIGLLEKSGGRSGHYLRSGAPLKDG